MPQRWVVPPAHLKQGSWQASCEDVRMTREQLCCVPNQISWKMRMKHQRHFETATREAVQTRSLIADLDRIVQILNGAIADEEQRAGIFDPFEAAYPMHARELSARRDNLANTLAALELRLGRTK